MISRSSAIPRFALPYTCKDFTLALLAILNHEPLPCEFGLLGNGAKFWTASGRQALWLLISGLGLKAGSGVALPLFTDPSLVAAIVAAGHRPVFIDIDPQFLTIDPQSLEKARGKFSCVVIVHLFGQMADVPALLMAAGNVPVIEDAAHAPLSYLNGRMAGGFGVAAFFSFASTKYWPAGGGGIAVANDPTLARRLALATKALVGPSRMRELRNVLLQGTKAAVFGRRLYGTLGRPMRRWADKWALLEPSLDHNAIQRSYATAACRQALRLPQRVEMQRANSLRLLSRLVLDDVVLPVERPNARYNYHLFPVLLRDSAERTEAMNAMWAQFVDTSKIYCDVVDVCRRFGYRGECPVAESVANRLMTLPNHASLTDRDIDYVADVFLSTLQACRHRQSPGRPGFSVIGTPLGPGQQQSPNSSSEPADLHSRGL